MPWHARTSVHGLGQLKRLLDAQLIGLGDQAHHCFASAGKQRRMDFAAARRSGQRPLLMRARLLLQPRCAQTLRLRCRVGHRSSRWRQESAGRPGVVAASQGACFRIPFPRFGRWRWPSTAASLSAALGGPVPLPAIFRQIRHRRDVRGHLGDGHACPGPLEVHRHGAWLDPGHVFPRQALSLQ